MIFMEVFLNWLFCSSNSYRLLFCWEEGRGWRNGWIKVAADASPDASPRAGHGRDPGPVEFRLQKCSPAKCSSSWRADATVNKDNVVGFRKKLRVPLWYRRSDEHPGPEQQRELRFHRVVLFPESLQWEPDRREVITRSLEGTLEHVPCPRLSPRAARWWGACGTRRSCCRGLSLFSVGAEVVGWALCGPLPPVPAMVSNSARKSSISVSGRRVPGGISLIEKRSFSPLLYLWPLFMGLRLCRPLTLTLSSEGHLVGSNS